MNIFSFQKGKEQKRQIKTFYIFVLQSMSLGNILLYWYCQISHKSYRIQYFKLHDLFENVISYINLYKCVLYNIWINLHISCTNQ